MQELEERIQSEGTVKEGDVLKVDAFLNHQCDVRLFDRMGAAWAKHFAGKHITKILTIEASGIGIAAIAAQHFGNVPVVFAKKTKSRNLDGALYTAHVKSFTKGIDYDIQVSQKFIGPEDCVLVLDDFLAKGEALKGLMKIVNESGAKLAGCGIVIEKGFQEGGKLLREQGIRVESLAIVSSISGGKVTFAE